MPGAGGATASAWLYRIAPKDGTAIASVSPNAILGKLLDDSQTQYDDRGLATITGAGEAAIKVWYLNYNALVHMTVPYANAVEPNVFAAAHRRTRA